jgi:hypothetical protein
MYRAGLSGRPGFFQNWGRGQREAVLFPEFETKDP